MTYRLAPLVLSLALLTLGACSLFDPPFEPFISPALNGDQPQPPAPEIREPVEVKVEQLPSNNATESKSDAIVLKWLVPSEAVDGYVIRYGFNASDLEYEERLESKTLIIESDPVKGKLFVHSLSGIPRDLTVYISIASIKDDQISKPTNIFSVSPASR